MAREVAVKRTGVVAPAHVQSNQTKAEVSTMNAHNTIINAIRNAIRASRYPGPWVDWQPDQDMDKFLLGLMEKPAVPDTTAWGRVIWRRPVVDALGAIPFLYQGALHRLIGQHFYNLLVKERSDMDVPQLARVMHDKLSTIRSLLAARLRTNHDEFAEAITRIEVAHQHAWQQDASEVDSDAEGTTMWVSCSIEQSVDDFADALTERDLNWATSILVELAGDDLDDIEWDGWDKVALDRIPVDDNRRKKAKEQLKTPRMRFWAVNKLYRALIKELWSLQSLRGYWEYRLDRATGEQGRPQGESYAGGEDELLQIGRIEHIVSHEGYDMTGHRDGGPEREVLKLIDSELVDLERMIQVLENVQWRVEPIWRVVGQDSIPFWYDRKGTCYTVHQKEEAMQAREAQRAEWMRTRDAVVLTQLTQEELELLAELTQFDTGNAE